jgi:hypothetical protein
MLTLESDGSSAAATLRRAEAGSCVRGHCDDASNAITAAIKTKLQLNPQINAIQTARGSPAVSICAPNVNI